MSWLLSLGLAAALAGASPIALAASPTSVVKAGQQWFTTDPSLGCVGAPLWTVPCELEHNNAALSVYYGDATGDGSPADALVVARYSADPRGNAISYAVAWFHHSRSGWRFVRRLRGTFGLPKQVIITRNTAVIRVLELRPGDPQCCPTGDKSFKLRLTLPVS